MKTTLPRRLLGLTLGLGAACASGVTFTSDDFIGAGNASYENEDVVVQACTVTINGAHTFKSLSVEGAGSKAGVVSHSPANNGEANNRLLLTITGDVNVGDHGRIDATARGYLGPDLPGSAPQTADDGGGGGHGGDGGWAYFGPAEPGGPGGHGSIVEPMDFGGSGCGPTDFGTIPAPGGGAIKLSVGGTLTVNGAVLANGSDFLENDGGGGAGGSIWIVAHHLTGNGTISASGGLGEAWTHGGGGGGGRIALYYASSDFAGTVTAQGGPGKQRGGAGTIYRKALAESVGTVLLDNAGGWGASTPLVSPVAFNLTITNMAQAYPTAPLTLLSLRVATNSALYHLPTQSLSLTIQGDATIDSGGSVNGNGRGYPIGTNGGPGQGLHANTSDGTAGGGGHGGNGGHGFEGALAAGGTGYGDILQPITFGSAGGYGDSGPELVPGGGAIKLTVGGTMTVDGTLSADGEVAPYNNAGGGAGGSIWASANALAGAGLISANGGNGEARDGGGGGGGRIALYLTQDNFSGAVRAYGGVGRQHGGAGTVYRKLTAQTYGTVLVDNLGSAGALTPLQTAQPFSLAVAGNAITYPQAGEPLTFSSLDLSGRSAHAS